MRGRAGAGLLGAGVLVLVAVLASSGPSALDAGRPVLHALRVTSDAGVATGFAVGRDRVVTVAHAVSTHQAVRVTVGGRVRRARVVRVDRRGDLALLAVPGVDAERVGTASAAAGDRLRLRRTHGGGASEQSVGVRRAIVAHVRGPGARHALRRPALELHARVASGDSGAPLLTPSGEVAGVVFAASRNGAETAYAVDAVTLARLLR